MLLSTTKLARLKGVTTETIRRWIREGKYTATTTNGGHFRINYTPEIRTILYARISSRKQMSSIETQKRMLTKAYPEAEFRFDVASGFNFKRREFVKILESCLQSCPVKIVVTTPDRLSRSGLTLVCKIIEFYGGEVVFLEDRGTTESFDTSTLIAFLTSFCNSQSGKRSSRRNSKDKNIS